MPIYNSALKTFAEKRQDIEIVSECRCNDGVAFVWDIMDGVNEEFKKADCMYSELPYPAGQKIFNLNANKECNYIEMLKNANEIIHSLKIPTVIITSKAGQKYFTSCECKKTKAAHGVGVWGYGFYGAEVKDTFIQTLQQFIESKKCILDICCGYGNTGMAFAMDGRKYIMTDYDKYCISVIKKIMM